MNKRTLDNYNPKSVEEKWYDKWEQSGAFNPDLCNADAKKTYSIVIPPPNVTGFLHIGHALGSTIQDVLIRRARMQGCRTLWLPGTDHAGIATQLVVSKELAKKGITKEALGREKFIEEIWKWKERSGNMIFRQLKRLGATPDWSRQRFTMDAQLSRAVRRSFVDLYNQGLIYRGKYMTNWCPKDQTAVSDLEVNHQEVDGHLYHISYKLVDSNRTLTIATTRPETLLGDTAVAVHPDDERYRDIIGKTVTVPLVNRPVKVIADPYCDPSFGTGVVKITPAHDPNDYIIGKKHNLEMITIFRADGTVNDVYPPLEGVDRFTARKTVVALLQEHNLLLNVDPHKMNVGRCQRCDTVIEPLLSEQWFCRMKEMADDVLKCQETGELIFYPAFQTKIFVEWMTNIQDWCLSRQIWWGHRIPAWYCEDCGEATVADVDELTVCGACQSTRLRAETDVLDTWFSSGLFPFSTMGWPDTTKDLQDFYPNSTLVTGYDILFFWVARMLMMGKKFTGKIPFPAVYLHGLVRDANGAKMSKTRGNVIDPLESIETYGADALRFALIFLSHTGRDVRFGDEALANARKFLNKIWNAAKFIAFYSDNAALEITAVESADEFDRRILRRFAECTKQVNTYFDQYEFHEAAAELYNFVWLEFCDWYIEIAKVFLNDQENPDRAKTTRSVLQYVFRGILRLLHPITPFISEELHAYLFPGQQLVIQTDYPVSNPVHLRYDVSKASTVIAMIEKVRSIRSDLGLHPGDKARVGIVSKDEQVLSAVSHSRRVIENLTRSAELSVGQHLERAETYRMLPGEGWDVFVAPLTENNAQQSEKLAHERAKLQRRTEQLEQRLADKNFMDKAPAKVIEGVRQELSDTREKMAKLHS